MLKRIYSQFQGVRIGPCLSCSSNSKSTFQPDFHTTRQEDIGIETQRGGEGSRRRSALIWCRTGIHPPELVPRYEDGKSCVI